MDLGTIAGIVVSLVLVVSAILLGGAPVLFFNLPSALIVVGGTLGVTMIRGSLAELVGMTQVVRKAFSVRLPDAGELIPRIIDLSRKARKEGMLALESVDTGYGFLQKAIGLCVDGVEQDEIRRTLTNDLQGMIRRHERGQEILETMGASAPAFGMIGTLIGLVQMLAAMNDPASIGPGMAVALLTTLYGSLLANVLFLPLADKLRLRTREESLVMHVCLEGVIALANGDNPNAIDQKLKTFLAPKLRDTQPEIVPNKKQRDAVRAAA